MLIMNCRTRSGLGGRTKTLAPVVRGSEFLGHVFNDNDVVEGKESDNHHASRQSGGDDDNDSNEPEAQRGWCMCEMSLL
jgi:hypothetical protein